MSEIFNFILVNPIINVLVMFYKAFSFLHLPYALGFAIIGLTVFIRIILYPLISSQLKSSRKMQELAPHISGLKEKHKGDAKRLQQETMRLYKENGVNPAAGCVPVLIQLPIIWALYSVLQHIVSLKPQMIVSEINKIVYFDALKLGTPWDVYFFGLPLEKGPSQLISTIGPIVLLVPVLTGLLQFILSKMLMGNSAPSQKIQKKEDFSTAFQSQSLFIFPVMIGFFSYSFPIGLSLYWNTFSVFGIIQQYRILGWGGLNSWKEKFLSRNK